MQAVGQFIIVGIDYFNNMTQKYESSILIPDVIISFGILLCTDSLTQIREFLRN